ncbi:LLM class flavin-dependent oxidoreductase [Amycolatopsis sp. cmx-4-83]|uniref:LLM class flavin-dependent oxidoreductase n=1 Tax=Amycolatopsis sp. cmx-4-83 TaxID=2790940 RepID=UPI00397E7564
MKFIGLAPIQRTNDPRTGQPLGETELIERAIRTAVWFEELGFDGFGFGERHHEPFLATAPAVLLGHLAAVTSRVRLFTGVTLLSVHDPVRVAEDYATVDHLSGGRLDLVVGKGAGPGQAELFGLTRDDARTALAENYRLLRRLWTERDVVWRGSRRPALNGVTTLPRPLQARPRIWHGSASSADSVELAAEYGDPLMFSAASAPPESFAWLVEEYRSRWARHGHAPDRAYTGAGTPALYVARTSQQALADFGPSYAARQALRRGIGQTPAFPTVEDFVERSPALIGSPEQVVDKVHRLHEVFGHRAQCFSVEPEGLTDAQHRAGIELLAAEVVPRLRRELPDPPWPEAL